MSLQPSKRAVQSPGLPALLARVTFSLFLQPQPSLASFASRFYSVQ